MKHSLSKVCIFLISIAASQSGFAIHKCIDRNGKTAYQEQPCPVDQTSRAISIPNPKESAQNQFDGPSTVGATLIAVPDVGNVGVMTFASWQVDQTSGAVPTIRIRNAKLNDPMSIALTFLPNESGGTLTQAQQIETVKNVANRYVAKSIEQKTSLRQLNTPMGNALLANFNEAKYQNSPAPQGEYSSVTTGLISHSKLSVSITILTNGVDKNAHGDALDVLASLVFIPSTETIAE